MKTLFLLLVVAAAGTAVWRYAHREPPDVSETEAKERAQAVLEKFCLEEKLLSLDFSLKGMEPAAKKQFRWAFRYENYHAEPPLGIVVSVGVKGDYTLEIVQLPPKPEGTLAADSASASAAAGAATTAQTGTTPEP